MRKEREFCNYNSNYRASFFPPPPPAMGSAEVASFLAADAAGETMEGGGGGAETERPMFPKRRSIVLTAWIACLSFLIFFINALVSLTREMVQNEKLWRFLDGWKNETLHNRSAAPPPPPISCAYFCLGKG